MIYLEPDIYSRAAAGPAPAPPADAAVPQPEAVSGEAVGRPGS